MSDPAREAARRAWAVGGADHDFEHATEADLMIDAAREALAPIRDLHKPVTEDGWADEPSCRTCAHETWTSRDLSYQPWPCATARLIYSAEELEAMCHE
ncbi:hypothetical protein QSJ18_18325 [Gordonia sp. ABSL1-1]|uniref:hypothetical protein n=1 Tax=Gordonia sp. ABSL1-1 TaxID=3053923 RepID=UPI0025747775|nr:hypothetical protein [Gordonia sp. ABSL1-1]MDL9938707.1 hypothetical protein [Gordonia sp. ABSL1-1]